MTNWLARVLMAVALCGIDARRRDWAEAMRAEFAIARDEGLALGFAAGCLVAAGRELVTSEAGWQTISSYALTLGIMLPMAALHIGCALLGLPYLYPGHGGMPGAMIDRASYEHQMRGVYQAAVPALAILMVLLGLGQLRISWAMLERDWAGVRRFSLISLAAALTLIVTMYLLLLDGRNALLLSAILAVELVTLIVLAGWQRPHEQPG